MQCDNEIIAFFMILRVFANLLSTDCSAVGSLSPFSRSETQRGNTTELLVTTTTFVEPTVTLKRPELYLGIQIAGQYLGIRISEREVSPRIIGKISWPSLESGGGIDDAIQMGFVKRQPSQGREPEKQPSRVSFVAVACLRNCK